MTTKEVITKLQTMPENASLVIFNPCTSETLDLEVLEEKEGMVQMLFEERPKTGHPFAPL